MSKKRILVTGGAGFIGINLAERLIQEGKKVMLLDNLSRTGSEKNLAWLKSVYPNKFEFIKGDIKDIKAIEKVVKNVSGVFHLAAQVAVTNSVLDPRQDFEINTLGTLNTLEAMRKFNPEAFLIFSSTNKVYGKMEEVRVIERDNRYEYETIKGGIDEKQNLDFYSPYGCSKGSADQYVRDYARIYKLKTAVCRLSCIYGEHQMGNEDQGWVAHFIISAIKNKMITIYGDGKQIRDILYIQDLLDAFSALEKRDLKGDVYNIGGGPKNTISLLELISLLNKKLNKKVAYIFSNWRPGDQKAYISNINKAKQEFGWEPKITKEVGIEKLIYWVKKNKYIFS